jgi:hypothetical protein
LALARLGDKGSIPGILQLLEDSEHNVRVQALQALSLLEAREAVPRISNLVKQTEGFAGFVCVPAAVALCQLNSAEGAPLLLKRETQLANLNGLRRPEDFHRLAHTILKKDLTGTAKDLVDEVAREGDLRFDGSHPVFEKSVAWHAWRMTLRSGATLLRALEEIFEDGRFVPILEEGSIRVIPKGEALKHWEIWLSSRPKQK